MTHVGPFDFVRDRSSTNYKTSQVSPDQWVAGQVHVLDQEADGSRLVRMTGSEKEGTQSILNMHYLVASQSRIEHFVESHRMTLFTLAEYESAFLASDLMFEFDQVGPMVRGALIGLASQRRAQELTVLRTGPAGHSPLERHHNWDLSTSNSQPGAAGSKPCSTNHRTATKQRNDHHPLITSRSTSVP
jgi:hypothetical protein